MTIPGCATPEGTKRFAARFKKSVHPDFYALVHGLTLSTLGIGTYLGELGEHDDKALEEALEESIRNGINVIDTAANYRAQRSERVIGKVLTKLIADKVVSRDEIFVSTKGGFIPFDGTYPEDPNEYLYTRFVKPGILEPADIVAGCHSISPTYIADQFQHSRKNLNLHTIDLYFLHNPETQLEEVDNTEFLDRLESAFSVLEERISGGEVERYGIATWNGLRVMPDDSEYLDLSQIRERAGEAFQFVQLPFNLALTQALNAQNQNGQPCLEFCQRSGIAALTSASIMQAKILGKLPASFDVLAPGAPDVLKALNFTRSAPGVSVALCGMKGLEHTRENLGLRKIPKVNSDSLKQLSHSLSNA